MNDSCDCLVVGAGPAGSAVAALVAEAGFRTLLVQHAVDARGDIGQVLMPKARSTLARLGVLARMPESRFLPSSGWRLADHRGDHEIWLPFGEAEGRQLCHGWHLLRPEFDPLLVTAAVERGAELCHSHEAVEAIVDHQRVAGVRLTDHAGSVRQISARVTVDASGRPAFLSGLSGRSQPPPHRRGAVWGLYSGAKRDGAAASVCRLWQTQDNGSWFWFLPLADDRAQVGVAGSAETLLAGRRTPGEIFEDELVKCPALAERLIDARLLGTIHIERDAASGVATAAGNGWVLVGEALAPADALLSSGAFLSLRSGELAAEAIIEGLKYGDTSGKQLGRWSGDLLAGARRMERLVAALASPAMNLLEFLKNDPERCRPLCRLLGGELFDATADGILEMLTQPSAAELTMAGPARSPSSG